MAQSPEHLDVDAAITAALRAEREAQQGVDGCAEQAQRLLASARAEAVRIRDRTERRIQTLRARAATGAERRIGALAVQAATVHQRLDDEAQGREALQAAVERLAAALTGSVAE